MIEILIAIYFLGSVVSSLIYLALLGNNDLEVYIFGYEIEFWDMLNVTAFFIHIVCWIFAFPLFLSQFLYFLYDKTKKAIKEDLEEIKLSKYRK